MTDLDKLESSMQDLHSSMIKFGQAGGQIAEVIVEASKKIRLPSQEDHEQAFRKAVKLALENQQETMDIPSGIPPLRALEIIQDVKSSVPVHTKNESKLKGLVTEDGNSTIPVTTPDMYIRNAPPEQKPRVTLTFVPISQGKKGSRDHIAIPSHLHALNLDYDQIRSATILMADLRERVQVRTAKGGTAVQPGAVPKQSMSLLGLMSRKHKRNLPSYRHIQVAGADPREDLLQPHAVIAARGRMGDPYRLTVAMIGDMTALLDHTRLQIAAKPITPEGVTWPLEKETLILIAYENAGDRYLQHYVVDTVDHMKSSSRMTWYNLVPVVTNLPEGDLSEGVDLDDELNG